MSQFVSLNTTNFKNNNCRICRCEVSLPNIRNLFSRKPFWLNQSLLEMFRTISPPEVKIDKNDQLPVNICLKCSKRIKCILAFRQKIKEADFYFRSALQSSALKVSSNKEVLMLDDDDVVLINDCDNDRIENAENECVNNSIIKPINIERLRNNNSRNTSSHTTNNNTEDILASKQETSDCNLSTEETDSHVLRELLNSSISDSIIITTDSVDKQSVKLKTPNVSPNGLSTVGVVSRQDSVSDDPLKLYTCAKCSQSFSSNAFLERHLQYHELNLVDVQTGLHKSNLSCQPKSLLLQQSNVQPRNVPHRPVQLMLNNQENINPAPISPLRKDMEICKHCKQELPIEQLNWHMYLKHKNEKEQPKDETSMVKQDLLFENCKYCNEQMSFLAIKKHIRIQHLEELELSKKQNLMDQNTCTECNQQFYNGVRLKNHVESKHKVKFPCNNCSEGFMKKKDLDNHLKNIHNVRIQSLCYMCGKMVSSSSLNSHYQTHVKRRLKCTVEGCNAILKYRTSLRDHVLRCHATSGPSFVCELCGKGFAVKQSFRQHLLHHVGGFKHSCPYCEKRFVTEAPLRRHLKVHGRQKLFTCPKCLAAFAYEPFLKRHIATKHW